MKKLPRGLRNNNPLNIRYVKSNNWLGKIDGEGKQDKAFEEFDTLEHGLRAAYVLLYNYMEKLNLCSINAIISRWAPMNENRTDVYVNAVSKDVHVNPSELIKFNDPYTMVELVQAMIKVECGINIQYADIFMAYYAVVLQKHVDHHWDPFVKYQYFSDRDWEMYAQRVDDVLKDYLKCLKDDEGS